MCLSGGERKRRDIDPSDHITRRAIQLGKAHVVANRQTDFAPRAVPHHRRLRGITRINRARLVVGLHTVIKAKQVDFVVARHHRAIGCVDQGGVVHLIRIGRLERNRTRDHIDLMLFGKHLHRQLNRRAVIGQIGAIVFGLCHFIRVFLPHDTKIFGQYHHLRAHIRRLRDTARRRVKVILHRG